MPRKFSKNGLPIGKTPSKGFAHQGWSAEEDAYLKMALEKRVTSVDVAKRLGRTIASIQNRKWTLKLPGRFAVSKRGSGPRHVIIPTDSTKPDTQLLEPITAKETQHILTTSNFGIGELETGIPIPVRGGKNEEVIQKLMELLTKMNPGQSFVLPKGLVYLATRLLKENFVEYKTKTSATTQDKKFYRIHRIV